MVTSLAVRLTRPGYATSPSDKGKCTPYQIPSPFRSRVSEAESMNKAALELVQSTSKSPKQLFQRYVPESNYEFFKDFSK